MSAFSGEFSLLEGPNTLVEGGGSGSKHLFLIFRSQVVGFQLYTKPQ